MPDSPTAKRASEPLSSKPPSLCGRKASVLVLAVIAGAAALHFLRLQPEPATPLVPVFEHLENHDYVTNRSLGGRYRPGDVLQIADPEPLVTPILALRSEMCFPEFEAAMSPFPLPGESVSEGASFGISGAQVAKIFPGLAFDDSVATSYRLEFERPKVVTAPKLEISGHYSEECVSRLDAARAAGDHLKDYATVYEVVIAAGMTLEVTWQQGTSAEARAEIGQRTEKALEGVATQKEPPNALVTAGKVKQKVSSDSKTVWKVEAPIVLGYRHRPMQYQPPELPADETVQDSSTQTLATPTTPELMLAAATLSADPSKPPKEAFTRGDGFIGRLSIQLQTDDGWRTVRPDRKFQTGDLFRFKIESSREAAVFVYHRPLGGDRTELWPGVRGTANDIAPGEPLTVPPPPAVFQMNDHPGVEIFSVALTAARAQEANEPLGQYVLRSLGEEDTRGVKIVDRAEHWLYFQPGTNETLAVADFHLRHVVPTGDSARTPSR